MRLCIWSWIHNLTKEFPFPSFYFWDLLFGSLLFGMATTISVHLTDCTMHVGFSWASNFDNRHTKLWTYEQSSDIIRMIYNIHDDISGSLIRWLNVVQCKLLNFAYYMLSEVSYWNAYNMHSVFTWIVLESTRSDCYGFVTVSFLLLSHFIVVQVSVWHIIWIHADQTFGIELKMGHWNDARRRFCSIMRFNCRWILSKQNVNDNGKGRHRFMMRIAASRRQLSVGQKLDISYKMIQFSWNWISMFGTAALAGSTLVHRGNCLTFPMIYFIEVNVQQNEI